MKTLFDPYDLKGCAREALLGNYGTAVRATLMVQLIETVLSLLLMTVGDGLNLPSACIVSFVCMTLIATLSAGYCPIYTAIAKDQKPVIRDLFFAFNNRTNTIITICALLVAIGMIWYIPFSLLLTDFLFRFYTKGLSITSVILFILFLIAALLFGLLLLLIEINFIFAPFLFAEQPERRAADLLRQSRSMLNGHRKELFLLVLSFLGYFLLGLLSLGIAMLWIVPYFMETLSLFYLRLADRHAKNCT